ncbi:hypothetical protein PHYSODRAFT_337390 [Phytophthora sojae]|uniref:Uncharacterized protein n=1 Tax=Phytophthora sojae (strain P6497) TaxID=1094619 RepID=G5A0X2_PHYSP|nr:hypothetical protein PHYSODRAFT_337390 [Phytophthora sojae]EGZ10604.1 hypothetical protein PHYSODRAFT_337390 [Phytophthora sojae]|eukprot:XP_009533349.1 hypothetical protein PHYSODRAFT_337390 [Phytophthora sojae]
MPPDIVYHYPLPAASSKAIRVAIAFEGVVMTVIMKEFETVGEIKERIKERMCYDFPAEELTILWAKKNNHEWLTTFDGSNRQLLHPGNIRDEAWDVLDNADYVMDPRAMVSEAAFEFRGVFELRSHEIHVVALLPKYRELSNGRYSD